MRKQVSFVLVALFGIIFIIPSNALAANSDPFRGGREAVNPKQSAGVGESTGAMTYSYPIVIPPGRNGVQPNLTLNYSSDDKRQDSIFGYGWSMSLPYIERVNKLGTNNLYNQDKTHTFFTSSLSGELLPVVNTSPIGGSFLGVSESTPPLALLNVPAGLPPATSSDGVAAAPAESPMSVTDEVARSFHTFTDTFLPQRVFHPNMWAEWYAARDKAADDAKKPVAGFRVAKEDLLKKDGAPIQKTEIISERTATSKKFHFWDKDGEHTSYQIFQTPVHYKDSTSGKFEDIDTRLVDNGNEFVMNKAGYQAHLSKNGSIANPLVTFAHDGQILTISSSLERGSRGAVKRPDTELPAPLRERGAIYPSYFGANTDLLITTRDQALEKNVIINSPTAFGDLTGKQYIEIPFDVTSPQSIDITVNGRTVTKTSPQISSSLATITSAGGINTYIFPPTVIDSSYNLESIEIEYVKTDAGFRMIKRIPVSFLNRAVYPIRADATFSITVATGDGYVRHNATTWSGAHDAVSGTDTVSWTGSTMRADSVYNSGTSRYYISRSFLPFDTSAIDDSAVVSSSTLYLTPDSRTVADSVSQNYIVVVGPTTQAATSSLGTSDYSKCGATTSPTEFSSHYSYSQSWPVGTAVAFTLNSSGTSTISKTGYTYLGVRSGFDVENSAPSGNNVWTFNSYDYGSGRPYLDIETTDTDTPSGLQVESLTNPSNIATSNPRFSAVYTNASSSALASYYEIQVSTTSSFTSTLYWDSGKKSISSSTPPNQRSPQIFSTTTFATDGTAYYWRIRFWDQYNTANSWSNSGDYFVMQVSGDYMARTDDGSMMKYTLQTDGSWIAYDKRGWKYTFGATSNARISDPSASSKIYRWYLEEIADPNGNKVVYRYTKDGGQVYPDYVDYTDHAGGSLYDIDFTTEYRGSSSDWATSSQYGFAVQTRNRVSEMTTSVGTGVGGIIRRFIFGYSSGDNQSRSLLTSIQEKGYADGSGGAGASTLTFPPTNFSYQTSTTTWTQVADANSYQVGFDVSDTSNNDYGWRLFDINGDALPDWFRSDGGTQTILLNTGSKWSTSTAWTSPVAFASGNLEQGVRMAEVNGDGLIDLIAASSSKVVYLNNGTSTWVASSTWAFPESFVDSGNRDQGVQLVDVNGDGLADVFRSHYASTTGTTTKIYINNGHGWTEDTGWSIPEVLINNLKDSAVRLYDYNGDGLIDIVFAPYPNAGAGGQATRVYYNTGHGWSLDSTVTVPFEIAEIAATVDSADRGIRFADINGDSCVDMIQGLTSVTKDIRLSNCGSAWSGVVQNTLPEYFRDTASDYGVRMEDIDGDGQLDMIRSFYDSTGGTHTHKVYLKNGNTPDILSEVMSPRKGRTTVGYQGSAEYRDGAGNLLNPNLPFVSQTVRTLTTDNGSYMGSQRVIATTTYDYQRGYFYGTSSDPLLRRFTGFGLVTATNSASAVTRTYFHQGNGSDSANGEFGDDISKAGRPYRTETTDQYGNIFTRTINKWARADYGDGRNFVKLAQTLSQTFDGDSSHRDTAASTTYDNTTGDISVLVNYGEVTGNSDGTFTDIGTDLASTTYTYAASSTNATVSYPSRELLTDQSGATVKDTKWTYDELSFGSVTYGNPTKEEHLVSDSHYASTSKIYDGTYGLVATSTDPLGNTTGYTYDGYNLFPTTVRNALGHQKLFSYDYSSGKAGTTTDENNQTVVTVLDYLDRPIQEKQPDFASPSTLVVAKTYTYTDATTTPSSVLTKTYLSSATTTDSYSYVDGFDRTVQSKREAESANGWITKDTFFNSIGSVGQETLPYFSTTSAFTAPTTTTALFVTNTYDPVGRVLTTANAVGTTSNLYSDWRLTVTDALGITKDLYKDAYGNLTNVVERVTSGGASYTCGGTLTYASGDAVCTFTSSGTFTAGTAGTIRVLAVAGGGGTSRAGSSQWTGGGGGGGVIDNSSVSVTAQTYTITVGAGGDKGTISNGYSGKKGSDSSFGALVVAEGGGGGAFGDNTNGMDGGSAGGGNSATGVGGTGTSGQGHNGSNAASGAGGGGGGANAAPSNATANNGANGGAGISSSISGSSVTYGGGGGGAGSSSDGSGGSGGGGAAGSNGTAGSANTGGGAGGSDTAGDTGAAGGSGIVVVRYSTSSSALLSATTTYAWNLLGKLTKITDATSSVRNFTYDNLGRLIGSEDLHVSGDSTFGTTSRQYDDAGNLIQSYSPRGIATTYTYDALNRVTKEDATTTATGLADVVYTYDYCTNGKGRLCQVNANNAATTTYEYNPVGLVGTSSRKIGSILATTTFSFLRNGAQDTLRYPEGHQITYVYNDAGDLNIVKGLAPGTTTWWSIIESTTYGPTGQPIVVDYGNNTKTTYSYDATKLYRLTRKYTVSTSTSPSTPEQLLFLGMMRNAQGISHLALLDTPNPPSDPTFASSTDTALPTTTDPLASPVDTSLITPDLTAPADNAAAPAAAVVSVPVDIPVVLPPVASTSPEKARPLADEISGRPAHVRANIKGRAIATIGHIPKTRVGDYSIEVVRMEPIDRGLQVFVRAWDANDNQIGFGKDGSVEIERFRIFNPPIMVPDGTKHTVTEPVFGNEMQVDNFKEDPKEALLLTLAHTISVKKERFDNSNILIGKVGNTTDTYYPDANTESTSVDGAAGLYGAGGYDSTAWATSRNAASGPDYLNDSAYYLQLFEAMSDSGYNRADVSRGFALFDTSALPDSDTISSATISTYAFYVSVSGTDSNSYVAVVSASPSSNTSLAADDFDNVGSTELSDEQTYPFSTGVYTNFTLNSSGIANITNTGVSKFAFRSGHDLNNAVPNTTFYGGGADQVVAYSADQSGTSNDPKLVIEHSAGGGGGSGGIATSTLQDLNYTYDAVGNITKIIDASGTHAAATTTYTYDELYRLTAASTTQATTTDWSQTYAYDILGNITNKSDVGSYAYAYTGFTNPHAPTTVNGVSYSYDNAGNLLSAGSKTYTWDYANRLINSTNGATSTAYRYDEAGQRVAQDLWQGSATTTTTYVNQYYEVSGATTTLYIYAGGALLATVEGNGSATTTYVAHTDHLNSTNVMTDKSGNLAQLATYYPFGGLRNNELPTNGFKAQRQFIGQFADQETALSYLNARYYDATRAQFTSQDPMFTGDPNAQKLLNPQELNSYNYAAGNPIMGKDPTGTTVMLVSRPVIFEGSYSFLNGSYAHTFVQINPRDPKSIGSISGVDTSKPFVLGATPGGDSGPLVKDVYGDMKYVDGCAQCARTLVSPPKGMSQADFERSVVANYNALPNTLSSTYFGPGTGQVFNTAPNSNNAATTLLVNSGIPTDTVSSYRDTLQNTNGYSIPGLGQPIGGSTVSSRTSNQVSLLLSQLSGLLSQLSAALKKK